MQNQKEKKLVLRYMIGLGLAVVIALTLGTVIFGPYLPGAYVRSTETATGLTSTSTALSTTSVSPAPCREAYRDPVANRTSFSNASQLTIYAFPAFVMKVGSSMDLCVQYRNPADGNFSVSPSIDAFQWQSGPPWTPKQATDVSATASPANVSLVRGQSTVFEYTIVTGSNSTGFIGLGLWPSVLNCRAVPIAVGYLPTQVNASVFPKYETGTMSCPAAESTHIVGYTGAAIAWLRAESMFNPTENITNIKVTSFPAPNSGENITFQMIVHSFSKPVTLGGPTGGFVRVFNSDPHLTMLPVNDACSWYPNNQASLDSMSITDFARLPVGYMQVEAPVLQIGPYSAASYRVSMLISGPIADYTAIDISSNPIGTAYFPIKIAGQLQTISGSCNSIFF